MSKIIVTRDIAVEDRGYDEYDRVSTLTKTTIGEHIRRILRAFVRENFDKSVWDEKYAMIPTAKEINRGINNRTGENYDLSIEFGTDERVRYSDVYSASIYARTDENGDIYVHLATWEYWNKYSYRARNYYYNMTAA